LLLSELNPSPRDLNQIPSVLLVDKVRHVETLGGTIKAEVALRFHVKPSGTCGLASNWTPAQSTPRFQFRRFKDGWPSRWGEANLGRSIDKPSTSRLNTKFSAELRKGSAQSRPQLTACGGTGRAALRA